MLLLFYIIMDTANNIFIPLSLCGFIFVFFAIIAVYTIRRQNNIKKAWAQVAEQLGMSDQNHRGIYPHYYGRINRVNIGLDVIYQEYTRARSDITTGAIVTSKGKRPWTRVFAELDTPPGFELQSRRQRMEDESQYLVRSSGDEEFDQKYVLYLPQKTAVNDVLTPQLKQALLEANPPVHIVKQKVFWARVRIVTDVTLLDNALRNCTNIATIINQTND